MLQTLPVYVISLSGATKRQALIAAHLAQLGIKYEWFEAVHGSALTPQQLQKINPAGNMSSGQVGCYLSHIRLYEHLMETSTPVALVLEDDTVLHASVKTLVQQGCLTQDFDYCFLGSDDAGDAGYVFFDASRSAALTGQHLAYPLSAGPFCTNAYLVTLEGVKKRLSCAYPARSAIDHYHYLPYTPRFMAAIPRLAFVSELSAQASMSSLNWSALQAKARQHWWYYPLRDLVKLKFLRKIFAHGRTQFPWSGHWKSLESAFKVVPRGRVAPADKASQITL